MVRDVGTDTISKVLQVHKSRTSIRAGGYRTLAHNVQDQDTRRQVQKISS